MSQHNELQGNDLHEPSTRKILNATGSELQPGTWVFIGVDENDAGFIPVTNLATAGQRLIGLVEETAIATNATGVVRTLGPSRADTSAFSARQGLSLLTNTGTATYAVTTDASQNIAEVITVGTNGTINIDTVTTPVIANAASTLENLTDVTITNRTDNDIIQFDAATSQWINVQDSDEGAVATIEIGGTGIVTVTFNDGTPDLQFQAGQRLSYEGSVQTYRPNKEYIGNVNIVDDLASETSKIYVQAVEPAAGEDPANNNVSTIIDTGLGGDDDLQPTIAGRNIRNNDGTLDLGISGSSAPDEADPFIDLDSPVLSRLTDSTVANSGIDNIADVIITTPTVNQVLEFNGTNWVNGPGGSAGAQSLEDLDDVQITNRVDGQKIKFNAVSGFWINVDDTIEELNDVSVNNLVADEVLVYDGGSWVNRFYNLFNLSDTNFANFNNVRPNGNGIIWDETGASDGSGAWVEKFIPTTSYFGIRTMPGTLDRIPSDANYGAEAQSAMFMVGEEVNDKYMDLIETTVSRSDSGVTLDFPVQYLRLQPGKYRFSGTYACTFVGTNSTHAGDVILQLRYGPNEADVRDSRIQQVENNGNENAVIHLKGAGADSLMESTNITINGLLRSAVAFEVVPTIVEFTKETYVSLFFHTNNVQSFSLANFFVEANPNNPLGLEITRLDNV